MNDSKPMSTKERLILVAIISALLTPRLVALGITKEDQPFVIGLVASFIPIAYHIVALYAHAYLAKQGLALEQLENPTPPAPPAKP